MRCCPPGMSATHWRSARAWDQSLFEVVGKYLPLVQWALRHAVGFEPQEGCAEAKVFWQIWNSAKLPET